MAGRPWVLAEQTHATIRSEKWQVAVLPFGATEPHNFHMPYGTDNYQVEEIASRACEKAFHAGARVLLLPVIPFGVNTNYLRIPGAATCSVTPTTLMRLTADLVESMEKQGIRKMLLLNGHGGNELKPILRELHHRTSVFLCLCDWYKMAVDRYGEIFDAPGEHADEVETSLGLAYFPEFVSLPQAGPAKGRPSRFHAINQGWISITRPWHLLNESTGMGNPSTASAEKGRRLMEVLVERLGDFLIELAAAEIDEHFPFQPAE